MLDLCSVSQERTAKPEITGLLFYESRQFMHVFGAAQAEVAALFDTIANDPKHRNIVASRG